LKVAILKAYRIVAGQEFQARGPEDENARSPKLLRRRGTKNQCYWRNGDQNKLIELMLVEQSGRGKKGTTRFDAVHNWAQFEINA
jgi:hypothetical protein